MTMAMPHHAGAFLNAFNPAFPAAFYSFACMSRYQLRRIYASEAARVSNDRLAIIPLDMDCIKFGRNPEQVDVILNSMFYNNMISREHSEIRRIKGADGSVSFNLQDRSLNGTYVNDFRANGLVLLHAGDTIKFGHVNGAAVHPGVHAPQQGAEFTFIFEKVPRTGPPPQHSTQPTAQDHVVQSTMIPVAGMWGTAGNPNSSASAAAASQAGQFAYQQAAHQLRLQAASSYPYAQALNPYLTHQAQAAYAAAAFYQQWPRQAPQIVDQSSPWMQQNGANQSSTSGGGPSCARQPGQSQSHVGHPAGSSATSFLPPYRLPPQAMFSNPGAGGGQLPPTHLSSNLPPNASVISQADVKRMECDSSVPSPPKSMVIPGMNNMNTPSSTPGSSLPSVKMDMKPSVESDAGLSRDLQALAASAAESSRRAFAAVDSPPQKKESTPSSSSSSSPALPSATARARQTSSPPARITSHDSTGARKPPRKSNEVARLLSDLTEGSWMHQAARKATASTSATPSSRVKKPRKKIKDQSPSSSGERSDRSDSDDEPEMIKPRKPEPMQHHDSDSDASSSSSSDGFLNRKPSSSPQKKHRKDDKPPKLSPSKKSPTSRLKVKTIDRLRPPAAKATRKSGAPGRIPKLVKRTKSASGRKAKKRKTRKTDGWNGDGSSDEESSPTPSDGELEIIEYARPRPSTAAASATTAIVQNAVIDDWTYHDPDKLCDAKEKCQKPQNDNINWVACDDCQKWYHTQCVGYDDALLTDDDQDSEFHCGCKKKSKKVKK